MSSRELRPSALSLLAVAVVLAVSGCTAGAAAEPSAASSTDPAGGVRADDLTRRLAEVESARQCAVSTQTFPDEAGITADLDARLAVEGLTHEQWKNWHDALDDSPDLVTQLSEVSRPGCAGA